MCADGITDMFSCGLHPAVEHILSVRRHVCSCPAALTGMQWAFMGNFECHGGSVGGVGSSDNSESRICAGRGRRSWALFMYQWQYYHHLQHKKGGNDQQRDCGTSTVRHLEISGTPRCDIFLKWLFTALLHAVTKERAWLDTPHTHACDDRAHAHLTAAGRLLDAFLRIAAAPQSLPADRSCAAVICHFFIIFSS